MQMKHQNLPPLCSSKAKAAESGLGNPLSNGIDGVCRVVTLVAAILSAATPVFAETPPEKGFHERAEAYVTDYLSDRRRAGSLVGSVIGGAMTAHPVGPVIGSLIGFIIGKETMHESVDQAPSLSPAELAAQKDLMPEAGEALPSISFYASSTGPIGSDNENAPEAAPQTPVAIALPTPSALSGSQVNQSALQVAPPLPPTAVGMVAEPTQALPQQLVIDCSSNGAHRRDPRLRAMCFYYQSN